MTKSATRYMLGSKRHENDYLLHNKFRFNHTIKILQNKFKSKDKFSILDIGTSQFTFMLKDLFTNANIYTLDYDSIFESRCKQKNISFIKENILSSDKKIFNKEFDAITFLETLEHIQGDHQKVINRIVKSLKKNGICILQTPNRLSFKKFCMRFTSNHWNSGSTFIVKEGEFLHQKEYSQTELEKLILSISNTKILSSKLNSYYEHPNSTLVYRKNPTKILPFAYLYYLFTTLFPQLRIGLEIVFTKK